MDTIILTTVGVIIFSYRGLKCNKNELNFEQERDKEGKAGKEKVRMKFIYREDTVNIEIR